MVDMKLRRSKYIICGISTLLGVYIFFCTHPSRTMPRILSTLSPDTRAFRSTSILRPERKSVINAVLVVRIYSHDKARWSRYELSQWVRYILFAGVEKIFLYDCHMTDDESLKHWALTYPQITYVDWGKYNHPYTIAGTQVRAYQHAIDNYGTDSEWQMAFDMDEYPFSPIDCSKNWLKRVVRTLASPDVSELSLPNYLFIGKNTTGREWVIERLDRRTPTRANHLDKPIYKPAFVKASVHHNVIQRGTSVDVDPTILRMNHYWGLRLQNWGVPCTDPTCLTAAQMRAKTVVDRSAVGMASVIRGDKFSVSARRMEEVDIRTKT